MYLNVGNLPENRLALTNRVYLNPNTLKSLLSTHNSPESVSSLSLVTLGKHPYAASSHPKVPENVIALNGLHRRFSQLALSKSIEVSIFVPPANFALATLEIDVDLLAKKKEKRNAFEIDTVELERSILLQYEGHVFEVGRVLAMEFKGVRLELCVKDCGQVDLSGDNNKVDQIGQLLAPTQITFGKVSGTHRVNLTGEKVIGGASTNNLFLKDFDFVKLGIGGLNAEFNQIFRRAFASRVWPTYIIKQMGITHVRGMLLYGPPGCGKTLIARQIGRVLNAREPKIVNGPEILDKYVGASEGKIRELFADAEKEQNEAGDSSMLHIIILDEMDAICKTRGSVRDGTGVTDSVVNQLLAKIDGIDSLNNILMIGMTNRKDMIDDALLRPGRLELHVEIGLPDEKGRLQILNIHTSSMQKANRLTKELVDRMPDIATQTKNFTGAEIEGLVKAASSFALTRCIDVKDLSKAPDINNLVLQYSDIQKALQEVEPKFGAKTDDLKSLVRNGIVSYGDSFDDLQLTLDRLVTQVQTSEKTPLLSVLLHGPQFSGKTALAASIALKSSFPFVRVLSADEMIGFSELSKCQTIHKIFLDSYKSPLSFIFLDDIERLLEYVPIGPRFSNLILQTLLVLLKKIPQEGRRLIIMGTTSVPHLLEELGIVDSFSIKKEVPSLSTPAHIVKILQNTANMKETEAISIAQAIYPKSIGIKQLLMVTEMAKQNDVVDPVTFLECLHIAGY